VKCTGSAPEDMLGLAAMAGGAAAAGPGMVQARRPRGSTNPYSPSREDTADDRGRILANEVASFVEEMQIDEDRFRERARREGRLLMTRQERQYLRELDEIFTEHFFSYDKRLRPPMPRGIPRIEEPWKSWDAYTVWKTVRFYPQDFLLVVSKLTLMPDPIILGAARAPKHRWRRSLALCFFVLLYRWNSLTWHSMEGELGIAQSELCEMSNTTRRLLMDNYRVLVKNLDLLYLDQHATDWAVMLESLGCAECCIGTLDGKAWQTTRPGSRSDAAVDLATRIAAHRGQNFSPNFFQMAVYNGHYKAHGVKVQHMVLANGIVHAFPYSLRTHDSKVFYESPVEWQLQTLNFKSPGHPNHGQPLRALADQAYAASPHLLPTVKTSSMRTMSPIAQAAAKSANAQIGPFRLPAENSYQKITSLWPHVDIKSKHKMYVRGEVKWDDMCDTWLAMVFVTNLHTCLYGSHVTSVYQVEAPEIDDYLQNVHRQMMPPGTS